MRAAREAGRHHRILLAGAYVLDLMPAELSAMLDDYDALCALTHAEKKGAADGTAPVASTTLTRSPTAQRAPAPIPRSPRRPDYRGTAAARF